MPRRRAVGDEGRGARAPRSIPVPNGGIAGDHCAAVLEALGWSVARTSGARERHPDLVWAASGAMALTGRADGPPLLAPAPLASCARGAVQALGLLAGATDVIDRIDGARLLGERAACSGARRRGVVAPGGTCRLMRARDGWLAVNLARVSDVELLPAWLDLDPSAGGDGFDVWAHVGRVIADRDGAEVLARARLLGIPAAPAATSVTRPPWFRRNVDGIVRERPADAAPLVVDLSTLWAGPLAASLLGLVGARVIKVESTRRPDGARDGAAAFYDRMNAGKESVAFDLASAAGRTALRTLITHADIVVESARPRALQQMGIDAAELVRSVPGLVWVGITGYGRSEPEAGWVAFGDDASAAAGLTAATGRLAAGDEPLFCGDAIADPLTGVHAAVAALGTWQTGRGCLLDIALRDVTAHLLARGDACGVAAVISSGGSDGWEVLVDDECQVVRAPSVRQGPTARAFGADTAAVCAEFGVAPR